MEPITRISVHGSSESLPMKLSGDFDELLSCELIKLLEKNSRRVTRIFIHTSSLESIQFFGRDMFHRKISQLDGYNMRILFTGKNSSRIAPVKNMCI